MKVKLENECEKDNNNNEGEGRDGEKYRNKDLCIRGSRVEK
jgi:hypothetical protein